MSILENNISEKSYWYIACQSDELKDKPIQRTILNEWIVLFRSKDGRAVALQDRCPHRNFKLSEGKIEDGCLRCPYHGWLIDDRAKVIEIPSEGEAYKKNPTKKAIQYLVKEVDDLIYIKLESIENVQESPFPMPFYKSPGYKTVRLFNVFKNNVTNCAENYVDVPHTVFVHRNIFRKSENKKVDLNVKRENGSVIVDYINETDNLGWFSRFLNPRKLPIYHRDHFHGPNITSVHYKIGEGKEFYITSQCIPINDHLTHVYTDLTYRFGFLNYFVGPMVKYQGQKVIDQDIEALNIQNEVIEKYGTKFQNSPSDIIHVYIETIRDAISRGDDPGDLPNKEAKLSIWI